MKKLLLLLLSLVVLGLPIYYFYFKPRYISQTKPIPGTIILLNGTSSAGKTSIIEELQKIYSNAYVTGLDQFGPKYTSEHPKPKSMSKEEEELYGQQFINALASDIKNSVLDGKNVLVDVVMGDPTESEFDKKLENFLAIFLGENVVKILVYCPLDILVDHVKKRTLAGDERSVFDAVKHFQEFYSLQKSPDEMVVDRIATTRMNYALQAVQEEAKKLFDEKKITKEKFEQANQIIKSFVKQFKLDTLKEIVLVPKPYKLIKGGVWKWDLIVNTGTQTPAEIAHIIVAYLKKRSL